ncbi:MAG TPA: phosphatase PAP2 family protein [Gammaproteobacteria bacterium]|nr:phosphatase PAP2 family protein [Gammaproteobacteria bacterium]
MQSRDRPAQRVTVRSLVLRDWPRMLAVLALVTLATGISVAWIDLPLAKLIAARLGHGSTGFVVHTQFPDVLDVFVAVITIASWAGYILLRRKHIGWRLVCCLQVVGTALPFGYTAKDILKTIFGRVDTRYWMDHPWHFEFHWLHSSDYFFGFPSGHMAVFGAFAFAVMHYFPRLRPWGWAALVVLGAALVVSEYHFLGDVIAGTYVGYAAFVAARELPGTVPKY